MNRSGVVSKFSYLVLLLPSLTSAVSIDCAHVRVDGKNFDLSPLDNPHAVWMIDDHFPTYTNTTFSVNICRPLKKTKGVPKNEDCPNGSRVCAIERLYSPEEEGSEPRVERTVPIAGEFSTSIGGALDPKWTRLEPAADDKGDEGLVLEMNGGKYEKQKQKAVITFHCQKDEEKLKRRGDDEKDEDEDDKGGSHDDGGEEQPDGEGGKLKFVSWEDEKDVKILKLDWTTKYACGGSAGGGSSGSKHWGFFTWLIIILFLGVAAYLIFGSWLNYNRYSARGWDVLPHSDTIQDLPYLFRDWMRRVINTLQGGGSRGGYSAV